jgi:hypothetical protein
MPPMAQRSAMRWSSAAKVPSLILRRRVGCPTSKATKGELLSISAFVRSLSSSSWPASRDALVEDEHDGAAAFVFFGGEQVDGLLGSGMPCGSGARRRAR